jgi:hypothetical protein
MEKSSVCVTVENTNLTCRRSPFSAITCYVTKIGNRYALNLICQAKSAQGVFSHTAPPSSILPPPTSYNPNSHRTLPSSHTLRKPKQLIQVATSARHTYSTSLQTHIVQKDPRTLEFMSIENLKTFGESVPPFLTLDLEMTPRYCCYRVAQSNKECCTSCCLTLNLHSGLSLEIFFVTIWLTFI